MVFGIIAIVVVLLTLLIWLNVFLIRGSAKQRNAQMAKERAGSLPSDAPAHEETPIHDTAGVEGAVHANNKPLTQEETHTHNKTLVQETTRSHNETLTQDASSTRGTQYGDEQSDDQSMELSTEKSIDQEYDQPDWSHLEQQPDVSAATLEVMSMKPSNHGGSKVFQKPALPFQLYPDAVPMFASDVWKQSFMRLTEETRVVGWIAFQGDVVGASDHEYDAEFIQVLSDYRKSVEKLRREVGLSYVSETSIVGDEGKMWFISTVEDAWVALFVDRNSNVEELAHRLLASVRESIPTP